MKYKSVDPWSECLDPSYRGEGLPSSLPPSLWTCLLTFPPKTSGGNPQTTKPNHLFGQALQKPRTPSQVLKRVPLGSLWAVFGNLRLGLEISKLGSVVLGLGFTVSELGSTASARKPRSPDGQLPQVGFQGFGAGLRGFGAELPPLETPKPRQRRREAPPRPTARKSLSAEGAIGGAFKARIKARISKSTYIP